MKKYFVLIQKKIKSEKTIIFDVLYEDFLKLQISRFYGAKSNTHYLHKDFLKQEFDEMIKAAIKSFVQPLPNNKKRPLPHQQQLPSSSTTTSSTNKRRLAISSINIITTTSLYNKYIYHYLPE